MVRPCDSIWVDRIIEAPNHAYTTPSISKAKDKSQKTKDKSQSGLSYTYVKTSID